MVRWDLVYRLSEPSFFKLSLRLTSNCSEFLKGHISLLLETTATWLRMLVVVYVLCMLMWSWHNPRSRSRSRGDGRQPPFRAFITSASAWDGVMFWPVFVCLCVWIFRPEKSWLNFWSHPERSGYFIITFGISRRWRKMYSSHARLCVCLSVCICLWLSVAVPRYCMDPDVTLGNGRVAPSCALLGVWGTRANFNGFHILASLLHWHRTMEVTQTLHDVWPFPGLVHYVYIFGGSCPLMEFCQEQNSLGVHVLYYPILAALVHGTRAVVISQTLRRGTRRELQKFCSSFAQPVFGRAAIALGIGQNSSTIFSCMTSQLTSWSLIIGGW